MPRKALKKDYEIQLKKEFFYKYVLIMAGVMSLYALFYTFYTYVKEVSVYIFGGMIFFLLSYIILKNYYTISRILILYLIIVPLYNLYLVLLFGDLSTASFVWLIPLPLMTYVFFNKKATLYFSIYLVALIILSTLLLFNNYYTPLNITKNDILISDTSLVVFNIIIVYLLMDFKNKLYNIKIEYSQEKPKRYFETKDIISTESLLLDEIFLKIEFYIIQNSSFKDKDFSISKLSSELKTNSTYISKAIKRKGYLNFNNYINTYRVLFVKKLIEDTNLDKITLFYIYNQAGFNSQSTFNRVFKQIEGITPSEYIQNNLE